MSEQNAEVSWRNYSLVTAAYWAFTLSDGALRTVALLFFHSVGYGALSLAFLFLLYELAGIIANALGGWLAGQRGLKFTLLTGLFLQVIALIGLSLVNQEQVALITVVLVMVFQGCAGVAKDFTKMSSKSAIKTMLPDNQQGALFKWVAVLTGSKNALKGIGFFLGGALLSLYGYISTLYLMAGLLAIVWLICAGLLPKAMGKAKEKKKLTTVFARSRAINVLSAARLFLFASRDVWFVVGVPVFLASALGWDFWQIGGFMGAWTIGYGIVQAFTPGLLKKALKGSHPRGRSARILAGILLISTIAMPLALYSGIDSVWVVLIGLSIYGFIFALNSSVHSYLVLQYASRDEVATDVGFYYASNAAGRLLGTLASGTLAWLGGSAGLGGLLACLWGAVVLVALCVACSVLLPNGKQTEAGEQG